MQPVEPPATSWVFPAACLADAQGVVGVGADLQPGTLLAAYRAGIFPMPLGAREPVAWFSPDPRGVLAADGLRVSRSLRQATRRFEIRVDTAFDDVVKRCADRRRPHGWITAQMRRAYRSLHQLGWAHSVEAWTWPEPDEPAVLAGGLYGVAVGGLFAGESMWHDSRPWGRDASKVALLALTGLLREDGDPRRLIDVQWPTEHLCSLGVVELARTDYLARLKAALQCPAIDWPQAPFRPALGTAQSCEQRADQLA